MERKGSNGQIGIDDVRMEKGRWRVIRPRQARVFSAQNLSETSIWEMGPMPNDTSVASTSKLVLESPTMPNNGPRVAIGAGGPAAQVLTTYVVSFPPSIHTINGPNGTTMQIVELPLVGTSSHSDNFETSHPSANTRTKKNKSGKSRSNKGSPTKAKTLKMLQVWSPLKGRKSKSNSRIATLTLQEINVWTEAKNQNNQAVGERSATAESDDQPMPT
ncbi:unnamed protein product [Linum trigynum]|uniref:Uncharacterized protein n=1 Tax=Linum trigynum TaxID=586398 RepID=A0AAV2EUA9_9ROSI